MDETRKEGTAILPPSKEVSVIGPDIWLQVQTLQREGRSKSAIARELGIDRKRIKELATLRFIANGENVIILGPPGVGKTHLAIALGMAGSPERRLCPEPAERTSAV